MTREETVRRIDQKNEAVERMRLWGIYAPTIRQFENHNIVMESDAPLGACYELRDEQIERMQEFEKAHDAVVYHVIHSYTDFGEMENYLFVSKWSEEWKTERNYMRKGMAIAYVYNKSMPDCSEMGTIGIVPTPAAGLARAW